jgi:hypothetical protein
MASSGRSQGIFRPHESDQFCGSFLTAKELCNRSHMVAQRRAPLLHQSTDLTFCDYCLPKTMALALNNEPLIQPALENSHRDCQFPDRVLLWLAPGFRVGMVTYCRSEGTKMFEQFQPHQLEHLDMTYRDELQQRIAVLKSKRRHRVRLQNRMDRKVPVHT